MLIYLLISAYMFYAGFVFNELFTGALPDVPKRLNRIGLFISCMAFALAWPLPALSFIIVRWRSRITNRRFKAEVVERKDAA